jgi:hypothetical protein
MDENPNAIRAREDAKDANTAARTAGQSAMLINGGAATAILAFISKDGGVGQAIMNTAAICLGIYALGVCCGAFALVTLGYAIDWLSFSWEKDALENSYAKSTRWAKISNATCIVALICFLSASGWLAIELYHSP